MSNLLTFKQFADHYQVTTQSVHAWAKKGLITTVRLNRKTVRVPKSELARLFRTGRKPAQITDFKMAAAADCEKD